MMKWIDAHQHVWSLERGDYGWLTPDLDPLFRDYDMSDYRAAIKPQEVAGSVLIQAAPTIAETHYLLAVADRDEAVLGVSGWIDLESENAIRDLDTFAAHKRFKGIRPMLQDMSERDWIVQDKFAQTLKRLSRLDLCLEALIRPDQIQYIHQLAQREPDLKIVINHAAKPDIQSGELELWCKAILKVAENDLVFSKVSGFLTEAGAKRDREAFEPILQTLLAAFGSDRLMWGSDWPFMLQADKLSEWTEMSEALVSELSAPEREDIFVNSATHFYSLNSEKGPQK